MKNFMPWPDFCRSYYETALEYAGYHLRQIKGSASYDNRYLDEESVCEDAAVNALESTYKNFDPTRGASLKTYLSGITRNKVIDELKKQSRHTMPFSDMKTDKKVSKKESELEWGISDDSYEDLLDRLRAALKQLPETDQAILNCYINNPGTFVNEAATELGLSEANVSVRKNRAIAKLRKLIMTTEQDVTDLYEPIAGGRYTGFIQAAPNKPSIVNINPIFPQFDLEDTVKKLYDAIVAATKKIEKKVKEFD